MKRVFTAIALTGMLIFTSCGSKSDMEAPFSNNTKSLDVKGDYADYSEEAAETYDNAEGESGGIEQVDYKQSEVKAINKQMLVYSCDMSIDVLEFEESVDKFHDLIDKYNGFLESENYSDGGSSSQWQYADSQKWKTLNAVIRVPSADYDNFCRDAEAIGDMRRKNASVQNLTTEYSDLKTTLSIYEAKESRYLELLKDVTNEKDAVALEEELTSIQIEIARIKTRMNNIEGDVAYSYINLTLNEVREYTEEPVVERTDTFGQRLQNTVSRTWSNFLEFLEGLLFFIIRVLPYAVLIGIFVFIISKLKKALRKNHPHPEKKHRFRKETVTEPTVPEIIPETPAEENTEKDEKTEETADK